MPVIKNDLMMKLFLIPGLIMLSCGSVKSNRSVSKTDSLNVHTPGENKLTDTLPGGQVNITRLPACIKNKIDSFKLKEVYERPQRVMEYVYNNKKVYYVVMPCCDFFNEVYDDTCTFLGCPDGGFTGKGDGKLPDFFKAATKEKLIWESSK